MCGNLEHKYTKKPAIFQKYSMIYNSNLPN